jgi:hypothetical protein
MTSKSPEIRFIQHKTAALSKKGHKLSSFIVRRYGLYLRPSLYQNIPKMNKKEALEMEEKLALQLRSKRYAVWFN